MATATISTSKLLKQLKELAGQAGPRLYQRVSLASLILTDHEWIAAQHGGDELKARDTLQEDCFGDCAISLGQLLGLRETFPEEKQWGQYKYNVRRLLAEQREQQASEPKSGAETQTRAKYKEMHEKTEEENAQLKYEVKRSRQEAESLSEKLSRLEKENDRLRQENAELRGRVQVLEQMAGGRLNKAG